MRYQCMGMKKGTRDIGLMHKLRFKSVVVVCVEATSLYRGQYLNPALYKNYGVDTLSKTWFSYYVGIFSPETFIAQFIYC